LASKKIGFYNSCKGVIEALNFCKSRVLAKLASKKKAACSFQRHQPYAGDPTAAPAAFGRNFFGVCSCSYDVGKTTIAIPQSSPFFNRWYT
jgi:hypothetical protein